MKFWFLLKVFMRFFFLQWKMRFLQFSPHKDTVTYLLPFNKRYAESIYTHIHSHMIITFLLFVAKCYRTLLCSFYNPLLIFLSLFLCWFSLFSSSSLSILLFCVAAAAASFMYELNSSSFYSTRYISSHVKYQKLTEHWDFSVGARWLKISFFLLHLLHYSLFFFLYFIAFSRQQIM